MRMVSKLSSFKVAINFAAHQGEMLMEGFRLVVEYKNRKTLGIKLDGSDTIRVLAPKGTSDRVIRDALTSKEDWIRKKLKELSKFEKPASIAYWNSIPLLGENRIILPYDNENLMVNKPTILADSILLASKEWSNERLKVGLMDLYREKTRNLSEERTELYWNTVGKKPTGITVRNQKTRWASCSSRGTLSFNLRCSMLPLELFDYIVIHELCHLVHQDHSKGFWSLLESILPDYKKKRERLKSDGSSYFNSFRE